MTLTPEYDVLTLEQAVGDFLSPVLTRLGFDGVSSKQGSFKFDSDKLTVELTHDPYSYEIDIAIAHKHVPGRAHTLLDLVRTIPDEGGKPQSFFQASSSKRVADCVREISRLLETYGHDILRGDEAAYLKMAERAHLASAEYTAEVVDAPIRQAAEQAWQAKNYVDVVKHYGSLAGQLTQVELSRIAYARKQA